MIDRKVTPRRSSYPEDFNQPQYPSVCIAAEDLPEIEKWEVGESYCIQMKVTMTSKSDYKGKVTGNFDIKKFCLADAEGDDLPDDDSEDGDKPAARAPRKARSN